MSDGSKIDYVNATINPLGWGCLGPGGTVAEPKRCEYCYAYRMSQRHLRPCPRCQNFIPHWHSEELDKLGQWKRPRRIFVQSMGDLFGEWQDYAEIWEVLRYSFAAPQHTYLFLTKNPKRMAEQVRDFWREYGVRWPEGQRHWFGVSVTNQADALQRILALWEVPQRNLWLSVEPLHGSIYLQLSGIKWVVVGAETGNRKGKIVPDLAWVREIVEKCRTASVPVFMKSNLEKIWGPDLIQEYPW